MTMTIDEARAALNRGNARVAYGHPGWCDCAPEEGEITAVRGGTVFVRYGYEQYSKATRPEDLTLLAGKVPDDDPPPA
jgi:hypothetical protein